MLWEKVKDFWQDEEGLGTLEILLIVVVLVSVALMFRRQITDWVGNILSNVQPGIDEGQELYK